MNYVSMVREKVWDKLEKSSRNEKGPKNFDICFHEIFCSLDQILVFERETGHWAVPPTNFKIFLMFPSFLISYCKSFGKP